MQPPFPFDALLQNRGFSAENGCCRARSQWLPILIGVACASGWTARVAADDSAGPRSEEPRSASSETDAPRQHFAQALVDYRAGRYRSAIAELEAALALDPKSKDLVYNLALVHEKLGDLRRAIKELERYEELETDPVELERAKQAVERMRGAEMETTRLELEKPLPASPELRTAKKAPIVSYNAAVDLDPLLLTTTSISVAALATGIVFGIRALSLRPSSDPSTTPRVGIEALRQQQARAEDAAIAADISFGIGLVSGAASAALFFHRANRCVPQVAVSKTRLEFGLGGQF